MPNFPKVPPSKTEEGCKCPPRCSEMTKLHVRMHKNYKLETPPKIKDGMEIKFFIYRKRKVLSAADS
jgi:hypothetical protein